MNNKQRLFEVMGKLDKSFKLKINEGEFDERENLEYFLSFNNDDVYWNWVNGEVSDEEAIEILRDVDGISYDSNVNYADEYG